MKKAILLVLFAFSFASLSAQEVNTSEMRNDTIMRPTEMLVPEHQSSYSSSSYQGIDIEMPDATPPAINPDAVKVSPFRQNPFLLQWSNGGIVGYNGYQNSGFMYGYTAGANAIQQWGNLVFSGGLSLSKEMVDGAGVINGIGGNAMLNYRINKNVSLTAMGGITNYGMLSPLPSMNTAYYGGYLTLNTNNGKWALDLGVRRVYNSVTGQWETIPIAMPYYNLNGAKLGIDVGGLLYGLLSSKREASAPAPGSKDYRGPAIIGPPIDVTPNLRPLEVPQGMNDGAY